MTVMFWPTVLFMLVSLAIGLYTFTQVKGSSQRFTVCNKSMPFIVIGTALMAQAVDGNSTMGNTSLTYSSGIWAGFMIPLGLSLSLIVVGRFLAAPLNRMNLLTLPEFFFRRYNRATELLVSILTIVCFTVLIAGNLAAVGWILSVATGFSYGTSLLIGTLVIVAYTMAGGLYSAIWTDFFQEHIALFGFVGAAIYVLMSQGWHKIIASVPVDRIDMSGLINPQAGALVNWSGMIALAFGNAMALDFMERVFAAKSPEVARNGCYYASVLCLVIGASATLLGLSGILTVHNVGDSRMVLPTLASTQLPFWLGVMVFIGVLGASMSTANGAMLVISVVLARSVFQRWSKREHEDSFMLLLSRVMAIPTAAAGAIIAYIRPEPGILLVIAFDIVFAGCVAPLFYGVYWKKANSTAAISAIVCGTTARLVAYFVTPAPWSGLDTLIPPVISTAVFFVVCNMTWKTEPSRHHVLEGVQEPELA
jgi:SSS family solute:Na+ symporter